MKKEMKTVGKRLMRSKPSKEDVNQLQATGAAVRGGKGICPRGVFRFITFEEADQWMIKMLVKTSRAFQT